jgi:Lon protease-like protein
MSNSQPEAFFSPAPITVEELSRLPLFPLPSSVLFPRTFLPLHIFEPRYRVMVSTVIKEGGAMGVVMLKPGHESEQNPDARPPVNRVAGCGRIVHYNELADGRFMILLRGTSRVAIERELPATQEPFRRFLVSELLEDEMHGSMAENAMATMHNCATQIALAMSEGGPELLKAVAMAKVPGELADLLASALIGEPELQQTLLETVRANARVDKIVSAMAELLLNLPGQKPTSGFDH